MATPIPLHQSAGPVAGTACRAMVSPGVTVGAWPSRGWRWRACALALSILVLLVGLVVGATAQPSTPRPDPCSGPEPRPVPCAPAPSRPTPPTPTTPARPTTTPRTPCTGEDCIPQPKPTTPPARPTQPGTGNSSGSACGITDIGACITEAVNDFFRGIVDAALTPILEAIGHTTLSTPTIDNIAGIGDLWNTSWEIVVAAYGVLILVGGIVVMSHESLQARYSIKEIGPRIPAAFIASALSLFFVDKFIRVANGVTLGLLGSGVNAPSLGSTLKTAIGGVLSGGLFIILVGLVLVVVSLALLIVYAFRVVTTLVLIVAAPLFLMGHALPQTDPLARWWWKAITATLAIQVVQALVLMTAVRTFLGSGAHWFNGTTSALGLLVSSIALFVILFKVPFWLLRAVRVSSGRSLVAGLARAFVAAKAFGMVAGRAGALSTAGSSRGARAATSRHGGRPSGGGEPADPPWPAVPRFAPSPEVLAQRLKTAHDADRVRAARRSRLPSQEPRFLQPQPQASTHDPASTLATPGRVVPDFSSPPSPATPTRAQRPGSLPRFQPPASAGRGADAAPSMRSVRVASVPALMQFRPATAPTPPSASPPATSAPTAPTFRPSHPEPRLGDAYRRTQSVPPPVFRAQEADSGGEGT
ncbi:hypothetical protein [Allokutzneria sp. NRRL B-24872]|uniref:hypothetical protein n=1 Tax=Allokutzneria sp. NRRL B-24872 TaxID=1137961 RepID=UPI000A3812DD|nr:hypothetical protein [Allokutzneria sp. NRRL B-24872]